MEKITDRDRVAAENFAKAVNEAGVLRVIYLGNKNAPQQELSKHMRSRMEVGEILKKSNADVTIFKALSFWDKEEDLFKCCNTL